jgi:hypothetical protein
MRVAGQRDRSRWESISRGLLPFSGPLRLFGADPYLKKLRSCRFIRILAGAAAGDRSNTFILRFTDSCA